MDRVCLGHRGVWWAEIETEGKMAHGSMPFLGDCAVRHMGAVLARFERELYPSLAAKRTNMPVVPEGARQSTLNINSFHGGLAEGFDGLPSPLVPDRCRMVIDRRFLIEEKLEEVKAEVRGLLETLALERPNCMTPPPPAARIWRMISHQNRIRIASQGSSTVAIRPVCSMNPSGRFATRVKFSVKSDRATAL